jgi:hypothetical protein
MTYLEEFLTYKPYKNLAIAFSFFIVFFTDIYKNEIFELNIDNSTVYDYNFTNINECNQTIKLIHDYKINNLVTFGFMLILLIFLNFTNLQNRKNFCLISFIILIINFIFGSFIQTKQFYYKCVNLIIDYNEDSLILFYINYVFVFCVILAYLLQIKYNSNYNEINNTECDCDNNDELPKYNDIFSDRPPPLYENIISDGLPPSYQTQSQPTQSQPTQSQPSQSQPTQSQPTQSQPSQSQPSQSQPSQSQPTQSQPSQFELQFNQNNPPSYQSLILNIN